MCKGRAFALREMLIYTAVIVTFYDIEPAGGRWAVPKLEPRAASKHSITPIRGWIKKREFPVVG